MLRKKISPFFLRREKDSIVTKRQDVESSAAASAGARSDEVGEGAFNTNRVALRNGELSDADSFIYILPPICANVFFVSKEIA